MMTKHTPGPWRYASSLGIVEAPCGTGICDIYESRVSSPPDLQLRANARLIASAPDLLALALQYRGDLRYPPSADSITRRLAAIDAVLAKVTGE